MHFSSAGAGLDAASNAARRSARFMIRRLPEDGALRRAVPRICIVVLVARIRLLQQLVELRAQRGVERAAIRRRQGEGAALEIALEIASRLQMAVFVDAQR